MMNLGGPALEETIRGFFTALSKANNIYDFLLACQRAKALPKRDYYVLNTDNEKSDDVITNGGQTMDRLVVLGLTTL